MPNSGYRWHLGGYGRVGSSFKPVLPSWRVAVRACNRQELLRAATRARWPCAGRSRVRDIEKQGYRVDMLVDVTKRASQSVGPG